MSQDDKNINLEKTPLSRKEKSTTSLNIEDRLDSLRTLEPDLTEYLSANTDSLGYQTYPGTERIEYNFEMERLLSNSTSLPGSTAHLIKACLGAGVLNLHVSFMYGGLWTSFVASVFAILIMSNSMLMLVNSAQKMYVKLRVPKLSYPDLVEATVATGPFLSLRRFSKKARYTVDVLLFLELSGTCSLYEVIIADLLKINLKTIWPSSEALEVSLRIYILLIALPLLTVCLVQNLKVLAPFSIVADFIVVVTAVGTVVYSTKSAGMISEMPAWKGIHGLIKFFGIYVYAVDAVTIALPVENSMKTPRHFSWVVQWAMSIVGVLTIAIGFFGYWGWGEDCVSPVTSHLPHTPLLVTINFLLIIMLIVTFCVLFWVPFRVIWHYLGRYHKSKRGHWERFYKAIHVCFITCLAVAIPVSTWWMMFLGNVFLAFLALILPAFIEYSVMWNERSGKNIRWYGLKHALILVMATIMILEAITSFADEEGLLPITEE